MMDDKLCKRLKDAGFPHYDPHQATLSDLIDGCGKQFMNLRKAWDSETGETWRWLAEAHDEKATTTIAKTPEEAVAKLYLTLNS